MFRRNATRVRAPEPAVTGNLVNTTVNSSICGGPPVDLPNLDMNVEGMSRERRQQLLKPSPVQSEVLRQLQGNDVQVRGSPANAVNDLAKAQPCAASHTGQARIGRDFQSFDVAPAPRLIKAHRRRHSPRRISTLLTATLTTLRLATRITPIATPLGPHATIPNSETLHKRLATTALRWFQLLQWWTSM